MESPVGPHEEDRLRELARIGILRAPADPALGRICEEARRRFEVALRLITLVDRDRLRIKGSDGIPVPGEPDDRGVCSYTILTDDVFVIGDMLTDHRFKDNPWVAGEPHVRFYAGAPLIYGANIRLGSLCLLDTKPRTFSRGDKAELLEMADRVVTRIVSWELARLDPMPGYSH